MTTFFSKGRVGAAIAALVLCVAPSQAAVSDAQKCAAAKLKASGKYALCRAKAMAVATKTAQAADFSKCDEKLQAAVGAADTKYGAACAAGNGQSAIGLELADEMTNLGCRIANPLNGTPGSVLVFDVADASTLANAKMFIRNTSNQQIRAHCFITDTANRCSDSGDPCLDDNGCAPTGSCVPGCNVAGEFSLTLFAQRQIYWYPSWGTGGVPPFTSRSGQVVCVEVGVDGSPIAGNSLLGGLATGTDCPSATAIAVAGDPFAGDGDSTLTFGPGAEYGSCPAGIDPTLIEGCWSQSPFTFVCN
jgi:hypothetical protein